MKEPNLQRMSKEDIDEIKIDAYMSKEQTPIGYLFNGRFYKSIDELRGRTMSADNQPQPLFTENQCKEKVLEALEREVILACLEGSYREIQDIAQAKEYYETEVKPKYEK